jgi:imidazolonepropionase
LLRGAKQLLTLRGPSGVRRGPALHDLGIIEDGSVLIRDGTIAAIGSTRRVENLKEARSAIEIPVNGSIAMPAFVDPSIDLSLENGTGANGHPAPRKRLATLSSESLALMRNCLLHGTLTAEIKAHAALDDFRSDLAVLRRLANLGTPPIEMIRTWRIGQFRTDESLADAFQQTLTSVFIRKLARFVEFSVHSEQSIPQELLAVAETSRVPIKLSWAGGSPETLADVLSRVSPFTIACHSNLSEAEAAVLQRASAILVFTPGRELLEERTGDCARNLAEAGAVIAIGSGYDANYAPSFSMQMAIAFAVLRLRLPVEAAIVGATVNAAYAVGCGHLTGTLEFGKRADVLVLNVPDYREIPRRLGINHVGFAMRAGNLVVNRTRWRMGA